MILAFTGTLKGMTDEQKEAFACLVKEMNVDEFHHGDCIGADADSHNICIKQNIKIIIHPPIDDEEKYKKKRAYCAGYHKILDKKKHIERNHDMVDVCDLLIACPRIATEVTRSGTWATIRYARKVRNNYILIFPNGEFSIQEYNPNK